MASTVPTYSEFITRYSQFSAYDDDLVEAQIAESAALLNQSIWGDFYSTAIMLDTAHNLLLDHLSAQDSGQGAMHLASGPISSVSVAGMNTSFNSDASSQSKNASDSFYSKTFYGQKFLRLRHAVIPMGTVTS